MKRRSKGKSFPSFATVPLLLCVLALVTLPTLSLAFNCEEAAERNMRDDDKILQLLKEQTETASMECLGSLVRGNHFKSVNYIIDTLDAETVDQAIETARDASSKV